MTLYGAVDLHSNNSYVAITDEKDKVIKHKRLPNKINEIGQFFDSHKLDITSIVMESTYNGYWLMDGLQGLGYNVKLANPCKMKQYSGLKYTDDKSDCLWLNRMNRLGILPTGHIYPKDKRVLRDLLRKRMLLVNHRTALINSFKHQCITWIATNIPRQEIDHLSSEQINTLFDNPSLRASGSGFLGVIHQLSDNIKNIESLVLEESKNDPLIKRLRLLRGIGQTLSLIIRYETGGIQRFPSAKHYLSYCGLVESKRMSNNKQKGKNNAKNRNRFLRWAFAEATILAMKDPMIKRYHDRLVKKKGKVKTKAIIASKMARMAYTLMNDPGLIYDSHKLFNPNTSVKAIS